MNPIKKKYWLTGGLLLILVTVRLLEKRFFDDGLIEFFQYDYLQKPLPGISFFHLISIDTLRYGINTAVSIAILYLLFPQKGIGRFLSLFYGTTYIILIFTMWYLLLHYQTGEYLALFYVRRFIIQPILLFILIPALLYQKNNKT